MNLAIELRKLSAWEPSQASGVLAFFVVCDGGVKNETSCTLTA